MRPRFPSTAPPAFVAICDACWQTDPTRRPSFGDIAEQLERIAEELLPPQFEGEPGGIEGSDAGSLLAGGQPPVIQLRG